MYLFPYNIIKKNSKVIVYGYGKVGRDYERQVIESNHCVIVAIADKTFDGSSKFGTLIIRPEDIIFEKYDTIVIAIANAEIREQIIRNLICMGIAENRIIKESIVEGASEVMAVPGAIVHIGLLNKGGLGDAILDIQFIQQLRRLFDDGIRLTYITNYITLFEGSDLFDEIIRDRDDRDFDVLISNRHYNRVLEWNPKKIKKQTPLLYSFCKEMIDFDKKYVQENMNMNSVITYGYTLNKKRIDICDIFSILGVDRYTPVQFGWRNDSKCVLKKYDLYEKRYIAINRDIDYLVGKSHTKMWPVEYYNELILGLKERYCNIEIVKVGARSFDEDIKYVDMDISGQTSIEELKIILKNALFLISSEGGLVHMNHFLRNTSVVVYGPTDENYFGYEEDVIIANRTECTMPCNYLLKEWRSSCIKGFEKPKCMYDISPQMVMDSIIERYNSILLEDTIINNRIVPVQSINQYINGIKKIAIFAKDYEVVDTIPTSIQNKKEISIFVQDDKKFYPYSFWNNLPIENCKFDCIIILCDYKSDNYGFHKECSRIVKEDGIIAVDSGINYMLGN